MGAGRDGARKAGPAHPRHIKNTACAEKCSHLRKNVSRRVDTLGGGWVAVPALPFTHAAGARLAHRDQRAVRDMMKDPFAKTISYRLNHTARLQRALSARLLSDLGLFPGQETVLKLLSEQDGRTMGDLATALRVRPPTASKTVARLTAQGLVQRRTSDGDGRIVRVFLTAQGAERASSIDSIWGVMETEITAGLDGKERKRLRKLLRKVEKNLALRLGTNTGAHDTAEDGADDDGPDEEDDL